MRKLGWNLLIKNQQERNPANQMCFQQTFSVFQAQRIQYSHSTETLYVAHCLAMYWKELRSKLEAKERKILRKTLGAVKENCERRRRHKHELYTRVEKMIDTVRRRRTDFYGHATHTYAHREINKLDLYLLSE